MAASSHPSDVRLRWAGAALAIVAVSAAVTAEAGTRPSYDAYGWLVWGHMTLHGGLNTNAAPSFKPLPYVFTLAYGLLGRSAAMWLWMGTATAVSLAGLVFAGRLAYRLTGASDASGVRRWIGWASAVLAAAGLLAIHDEFPYGYLHYVLSAQSDPMVVTFVLAAIDCHLHRRHRWTFALLVLASLGRPEAWPLLLVDAAWLWRTRPGSRPGVLAGLAAVGLLWFGVPALTSRSWLIAADNAHASGFGPRGNRALGVLSRFVVQTPWPLEVAAALGVAYGAWRRDRLALALGACVVVWMAVEVAFGLHGWPALGRYMFEPSALVVVLGAGCAGRLAAGASTTRSVASAGAGLLAAAVVAGTIPFLVMQGRDARADLLTQRTRTTSIDRLTALVTRLGGAARVRACGEAISDDDLEAQTVLAYVVGRNVNAVGYRFPQPGHPHNPIVVFSPRADGAWSARALRQVRPGCRALQRRGAIAQR